MKRMKATLAAIKERRRIARVRGELDMPESNREYRRVCILPPGHEIIAEVYYSGSHITCVNAINTPSLWVEIAADKKSPLFTDGKGEWT